MLNTYSQSAQIQGRGRILNSGKNSKDWRKKKIQGERISMRKDSCIMIRMRNEQDWKPHTQPIHLVEKQKLTRHCKTIIRSMKKEKKSLEQKIQLKGWSSNQCSEIILMGYRRRHEIMRKIFMTWSQTCLLFLMITNFSIMNFSQVTFFNGAPIFLCLLYRKPLLWWPRIMGPGKQTFSLSLL